MIKKISVLVLAAVVAASSVSAEEQISDLIQYKRALNYKPGFIVNLDKNSLATTNSRSRIVLPSGLGASADIRTTTGVSTMELTVDSSKSETILGKPGRTTLGTLRDGSGVNGRMTISEVGTGMYGLIETPTGEHFVIKNAANGETEITLALQRDEGPDTVAPLNFPGTVQPDSNNLNFLTSADPATAVVDLLVVYSPNALAEAGNQENMLALISNAITISNQAFIASADNNVPAVQLHLVGAFVLSNPDTGDLYSELINLASQDGLNDEVLAARDASGADLVVEITQHATDYCGLAFVADSYFFAISAFATVAIDCAVDNITFPHEVGHLLGMNHAHGDDDPNSLNPILPYAFGNRFTGSNNIQYRTIMAYLPGARISYFSNPNTIASESGTPTGVAGTGAAAANNALLVSYTAPIIANYRPTVPGGLGGLFSDEFLVDKLSAKSIKPKTRGAKSLPYIKFAPSVSGPAGHELKIGFKVGSNLCTQKKTFTMPPTGILKLSNSLRHIDRKTTITLNVFNGVGITTDTKKITVKVKGAKKNQSQDHPKYFKTICKDLSKTKAK